jgi:hypothetical protein
VGHEVIEQRKDKGTQLVSCCDALPCSVGIFPAGNVRVKFKQSIGGEDKGSILPHFSGQSRGKSHIFGDNHLTTLLRVLE